VERVPLEERLQMPTFVLQLWLRQAAWQVQVSAIVKQHSDEQQQSIEPFLVRRSLPVQEGSEEVASPVAGVVYGRGK